MRGKLRVIQVGLGALGRMLTPHLLRRRGLELAGAVDLDPGLKGRDVGEVAGLGEKVGVVVCDTLEGALAGREAEAGVVTTVSSLREARPQIEALVARQVNVVSSCEELSYPWETAPEASAELDRRAKEAGVSVLGTGVNPGFLMDLLPIALTAICAEVRKITVLRYQEARERRLPFQRKIGVGLTRDEFEEKKAAGRLRHVGLTESMQMIARRMGWRLERVEETIGPVVAGREVASEEIKVGAGMVSGVHQVGAGYVDGEERIRLEFRACLGEEEVQDTVVIEGEPGMRFGIPGGVNGDMATCAMLTNAIPAVVAAAPGLRTMADMAPVSWFGG